MTIERLDCGATLWIGGPVPPGSDAITIGSVICVRTEAADSDFLRRHELVHVDQWKRLGMIRFSLRYVGSSRFGRLRGYGHRGAYRRIPLEVEADGSARRQG